MQVGESWQVEQDKCQLERVPGPVLFDVDIVQVGVLAAPHRRGVDGTDALLPHGPVHEPEGFRSLGILGQKPDAGPDAAQRTAAVGDGRRDATGKALQLLGGVRCPLFLLVDPLAVGLD